MDFYSSSLTVFGRGPRRRVLLRVAANLENYDKLVDWLCEVRPDLEDAFEI
jgi:hypothetical protein